MKKMEHPLTAHTTTISEEDRQAMLSHCTLCPRSCGVNRHLQTGFCGQGSQVVVARASLHYWEEPCISGTSGSGTVFFGGCNLKCIYCQNHSIALGNAGKMVSLEKLAQIFLELQERGANNINLVTPTPWILSLVKALEISKKNGLHIPIVYNTGGYESVEALKMLDGLIDIYMPDMKYALPQPALEYSNAPDYYEVCCKALDEMFRQVGEPYFETRGDQYLMKKGVLVRHLLLPGETKNAKKVIRYLKETFRDKIYLSIMRQYTPLPQVSHIEKLSRTVTHEEYEKVLTFCQRLNLEHVFIQEGECAKESFIPPFDDSDL